MKKTSKWTGIDRDKDITSDIPVVLSALLLLQRLKAFYGCVDRRGAGAGGEATLAVQGLPAGAERVPAEATQATQVSLHSHVTGRHLDVKRGREDRDEQQ